MVVRGNSYTGGRGTADSGALHVQDGTTLSVAATTFTSNVVAGGTLPGSSKPSWTF